MLAIVTSSAYANLDEYDQFQLFTSCESLEFEVWIEDNSIGVEESSIRDAVESRLRSARLFRGGLSAWKPAIRVEFHLIEAQSNPFVLKMELLKAVSDPISGHFFSTPTWSNIQFGVLGTDDPAQGVLNDVRTMMDQFLNEYLLVNGEHCEKGE